MKQFNFLKIRQVVLLLIAFSVVLFAIHHSLFTGLARGGEDIKFGVVDLSKVIFSHKLSSKLYELDEKVAVLEGELYAGGQSPERLNKSDYVKVQGIHEKAREELEVEIVKVRAQIKEQEAFLKVKMKALEEETARELKEVKEDKPELKLPQRVSSETIEKGSIKFARELADLRERQLAAKKLELQKELQDILADAQKAQDEEMARFEVEILKANQNKKINLQFKGSLAQDDETRKKIKSELEEIEKEEAAKKQIKQEALLREFDAIKTKEAEKAEKELRDYENKLNADITKQLKSYGLSPSNFMHSFSKKGKIIEKYEEARKKMEQELVEARTVSLASMEAKRKDLKNRLKEEEKKIVEQAEKQEDYFSKHKKKQNENLKCELEKLKGERKKIYNIIMSDIRQKISKITKEEKISVVLSGYTVNINCEDLTDLVLLEMRKDAGGVEN